MSIGDMTVRVRVFRYDRCLRKMKTSYMTDPASPQPYRELHEYIESPMFS